MYRATNRRSNVIDLTSDGDGETQDETPSLSPLPSRTKTTALPITAVTNAAVLKRNIQKCLKGIASTGTFATFAVHPSAVNPELCINDLGLIGLPLSEKVAKQIIAVCHQAPYGKGSETIVDTAVRKTWELNPNQFQLRNPAWNKTVEDIVALAARDLGLVQGASGVRAELYKLLLYEEGAMFKPHKDSEKAPGMFATLVICLPSEHDGGEVRLTHNGQTKVFATGPASKHGYSFLAWYADVTHEVEPVTTGYRFVLTYNLIHTHQSKPSSAASLCSSRDSLCGILATWAKSLNRTDCPSRLAYKLQHKYTNANLKFSHLKGTDQYNARCFKEVCAEVGFCFYLANLERVVEGACDEYESGWGWGRDRYGYDDDDDCDDDDEDEEEDVDDDAEDSDNGAIHKHIETYSDELKLVKVVDADGAEVARDVEFSEVDIVQDKPFAGGPDDEDYTGPTGNEGVSATHYYRHTVLLIMPKEKLIDFLFQPAKTGKVNIKPLISKLSQGATGKDWSEERQTQLTQLCELIINQNRTIMEKKPNDRTLSYYSSMGWRAEGKTFSRDVMAEVVKATLLLNRGDLLLSALEVTDGEPDFSIYPEIGKSYARKDQDIGDPDQLRRFSVNRHPFIHQKLAAYDAMIEGYRSTLPNPPDKSDQSVVLLLEKNKKATIVKALQDGNQDIAKEDGRALVALCSKYEANFTFKKILPFAKRKAAVDTPFAVAFLTALFDASESGTLTKTVATNVYKDVLQDALDNFTLDLDSFTNKRQKTTGRISFGYPYARLTPQPPDNLPPSPALTGAEIATLIHHFITLSVDENPTGDPPTTTLFKALTHVANTADPPIFPSLILPFLIHLLTTILPAHSTAPTTPLYRTHIAALLLAYKARYIRTPLTAPKTWARPPRGCSPTCRDCAALDAFLRSPTEKVGRFPMGKGRRQHLHQRLDAGGGGYTHVTERIGNPQTLVVTKGDGGYAVGMKEWKARVKEAKQAISRMRSAVEEVLGEKWEVIMGLQAAK